MERISDQRFRHAAMTDIAGTSYVVDSLEAALWCFWRTNSFRDALLLAANLGDDADTTAAICGQVAGSYYGAASIPEEWISALHSVDLISSMADLLLESSTAKSPR